MGLIVICIIAFAAAFALGLLYRKLTYKPALGRPFQIAQAKKINIDGLSTTYIQEGRGQDVLLVHGIGASKYCWRLIFPELTKHFRVTVIDLPGFGDSEKNPNVDYGLDAQTDRLAKFVQSLSLNPVMVVGCSMGGALAFWLAKKYPPLVSKIVAICPAADHRLVWINTQPLLAFVKGFGKNLATAQLIKTLMRRIISRKELLTQETLNEYYRPYADDPSAPVTFWKAQETLRDPRLPEELTNLQTPSLVLYGEADRLIKRRSIDSLMQALGHTGLVLHPTGGHHLMEDDPDFVTAKIKSFFGAT